MSRGWSDVVMLHIFVKGGALHNWTSSSMHSSGHFIEGIKEELSTFRSSAVVHVRRETNCAAHTLTRDEVTTGNDLSWLEDISTSIGDIVIREQVVFRILDPDFLDYIFSYSLS
jgi:hypothetical protein